PESRHLSRGSRVFEGPRPEHPADRRGIWSLHPGPPLASIGGMRSALLFSIPLLAATVGACSQALTPNLTGTGGIMTGTGDVTGSGGITEGSGGTAGAVTGSGGTGGSNVAACNTLMAEYESASAEAQTCTVGASGQCQQLVTRGPSGCGCTYVNDSTALGAIERAWQASGCDTSIPPCDAIECALPLGFTCVATDGGSSGVCNSVSGTGGVSGSPLDGGAANPCDTFAAEYAAVL